MSKINYQALRLAAEKAGEDKWQAKKINGDFFVIRHGSYTRQHGYTSYQPIAEIDCKPVRDFVAKANPATVLELLDELEAAKKRIAELEAREILLPERSSMLHRTDFHDDYQTVMAYKVSEVIAAIRALAFASKERSMEIKPEDELSNIVLFPVKEDDPRNQVNFLYEPSERPYCHHASVRVDEKERQVRCKICGAVVEPFDWMLSVAKRETRLADDVRILRQEERERRRNIEKLIQIERNVKARIRRVTKSRTE
ncbi:ead/Ea22-like family protein (plasmid) [Escherichia coli]|nr:ead/Ea22-like family protein [Escherichia coli]EEZ8851544.1 ead/Ea22-like family protein [Escherichia coli]TJL50462.1 ead/Ea22-like family protein [Escherichia coli]